MGRKFQIDTADYDIEKATQAKEEAVEEAAANLESISNETVKEPLKASHEESDNCSAPDAEIEVLAEENNAVEQPEVISRPALAPVVPENEEVFRIKVTQIKKKETLSKNKMIKLKPSVEARINAILAEKYPGMSFNSLVNQLLQGWLEEAAAVDVESSDKQ